MTKPQFTRPSDGQLAEALKRRPQADHLAEQLDLVALSVRRTRQVRFSTTHWQLVAAAFAIVLLLLVLALVGSARLTRPSSGLALSTGWDILLMQGDGSSPRYLTRDADTEWEPTWSPDGTRLAYWMNDPLPPGDTCGPCGIPAPQRLVVADPFDVPLRPTVLSTVTNNSGWQISWSPDSRRIVLSDVENGVHVLALIDVETGIRTRLGLANWTAWDAAWSPDGRGIAFAHGRDDPSQRALEVIDPDGTNIRRLTTIPSRGSGFGTPVWSPLGDRIAFAAETAGPDPFQKDIWIVDLHGSPEIDVSNDPADETGVNWSTDGSQLAWLRAVTPGGAQYQVVVADASGSRASVLPLIVGGTPPLWSPDGTHVLAVELATGSGGSDRLVSIDVRTAGSMVVMESVPDDVGSWQPTHR